MPSSKLITLALAFAAAAHADDFEAWAKVEGGRYYMSRAQYDSCYEQ